MLLQIMHEGEKKKKRFDNYSIVVIEKSTFTKFMIAMIWDIFENLTHFDGLK